MTAPSADEHEPGRDREEAAVVVAGRADLARVVDRLDAAEEAEESEDDRDQRAQARAHARVDDRGCSHERERHQAAGEVVGRMHAGIRLEEAVVRDVEADDGERRDEDAVLRARPRRNVAERARARGRKSRGGRCECSWEPRCRLSRSRSQSERRGRSRGFPRLGVRFVRTPSLTRVWENPNAPLARALRAPSYRGRVNEGGTR